jgi:hypothetical protein
LGEPPSYLLLGLRLAKKILGFPKLHFPEKENGAYIQKYPPASGDSVI